MYILFALRIHHENFIGKYNTIQCNDCFPGFDKDDVKIWIALKGDYSVNYMDELNSESVRDLRDTRDTDRESISIVAIHKQRYNFLSRQSHFEINQHLLHADHPRNQDRQSLPVLNI